MKNNQDFTTNTAVFSANSNANKSKKLSKSLKTKTDFDGCENCNKKVCLFVKS